MRLPLHQLLVVGVSFALLCVRASAQAPRPVDGNPEALFEQGVRAADAGRWAEAERAFGAVCETAATANALLNLATARYHLGKGQGALEALQRLEREADASPQEREMAAHMRPAVEKLLATLALRVQPEDATLHLDGRPVPEGERQLRVDPGSHRVDARAEGHVDGHALVDVAAGERATVQLSLARLPPPVVEESVREPLLVAPSSAQEDEADPHRRRRRWLWATGAVLVAGAAAAVVAVTTTRSPGVTGCFSGADDAYGGSACAQ